ncbi:MAG TPA: glucosaminidase domain-containing protein [Saprospiraceae bacterium]|nr:glucosaminidase domain-containing protein [Saprospiraceae bacterium]HND89118.1 glucosaminidase domain-containing protein [Saprospiraceae bacterium]
MTPTHDIPQPHKSRRIGQRVNAPAAAFSEPVIWKLLLLSALACIVWGEQINIVLGPLQVADLSTLQTEELGYAKNALFGGNDSPRPALQAMRVALPPGEMSNTTLAIDPTFARRNGVPAPEAQGHAQACLRYVQRFAPVATAEMRRSGIPASIILAQGLLESNAGASPLAQKTNNHFGIKCFSKRCKRGHCANFTDDSHKDFFVKYPNAWGSYRAHSQFLKGTARYAGLFRLPSGDYAGWARGLAKAGYATDRMYGEKLIAIIHNLGLHRYDQAQ